VDNCTVKLKYGKGDADYENLRKCLDIDWIQVLDNFDNDVDKVWNYF